MRIARLLGALGALGLTATSSASQLPLAAASSLSSSSSSASSTTPSTAAETAAHASIVGSTTAFLMASRPVNATTPFTTATTISSNPPDSTKSRLAEVTGGAIPQQMQASMVGLLGFCIMGLVML